VSKHPARPTTKHVYQWTNFSKPEHLKQIKKKIWPKEELDEKANLFYSPLRYNYNFPIKIKKLKKLKIRDSNTNL
jgi:hypothetical protein